MSKSYLSNDILKTKINSLLKNGRKQIPPSKKQLSKFPIGSLISHINNNNVFKHGGFLTKITNLYFIYLAPDFTNKFRVRFKNIKKIFVGSVYTTHNDLISIVKTKQKKTNFLITINGTIVYYAQKNFDRNRFKNSKRFQLMVQWYKYFMDPQFHPDHEKISRDQLKTTLKKYHISKEKLDIILEHLTYFKEFIHLDDVSQFGDAIHINIHLEVIFDGIKYDLPFGQTDHAGARIWYTDTEAIDDKLLCELVDIVCDYLSDYYH